MKLKQFLAAALCGSIVLSGSSTMMFESQAGEIRLSVDTVSSEDTKKAENSWRYQEGELTSNTTYSLKRSVSYPYAWEYVDGNYMNDIGEVIEGATMKGIDVSHHQGVIDWEKVKEDGIDFAIIRCGYGDDMVSQDDRRWEYNVTECERLGIPYGVYIYSYATNEEMALSEANHALRLLEGHEPAFPVYLDMEDNSTISAGNEMLASIAKLFCDTVSEAGYDVGIYANKNWWNTYLTDEVFQNPDWSKWLAHYTSSTDYTGEYVMWQCTDSGDVDGISGNVDLNFWFAEPVDEGGSAPVVENVFLDVSEDDWFYNGVMYVYEKELMIGMTEVTFAPNGKVRRSEFATILHRMAGEPEVEYSLKFSDVKDGIWYTDGILWGSENGIILGYSTGEFGINDNISREQMAVLMYRYADAMGYDVNLYSRLDDYKDASNISSYAVEAMEWAVGNGIISGVSKDSLAPKGEATRAQCATIIQRFNERYSK